MSRVPKSIKSTQQILRGSNHILHSLYAQSQDLRTIQQIVDNVLDVETSVASLKNNELTLLTARSTQATQTRYRQRTIISALRRRGLEVSSLKIKVQPIFSANKLNSPISCASHGRTSFCGIVDPIMSSYSVKNRMHSVWIKVRANISKI